MKRNTIQIGLMIFIGFVLTGCISGSQTMTPVPNDTANLSSSLEAELTTVIQPEEKTPTNTPEFTSTPATESYFHLDDAKEVSFSEFSEVIPSKYALKMDHDDGINYLIELETGKTKLLSLDPPPFGSETFIRWEDEGCRIVYNYTNKVFQADLNTMQTTLLTDYAEVAEKINRHIRNFNYSPIKENEVLLTVVDGESHPHPIYEMDEYYYDKQDILLYNLKTGESNMISKNGGVWHVSWSPDARWVIFSDYDENQLMQYHLYDVETQTSRQFTFFEGKSFDSFDAEKIDWHFREFRWSKDSEHVLYWYDPLIGGLPHYVVVMNVNTLAQVEGKSTWTQSWVDEAHFYLWEKNIFSVYDLAFNKLEDLLTFDSADSEEIRRVGPLDQAYNFWGMVYRNSGERAMIVFNVKTNEYAFIPNEIQDLYPSDILFSPDGTVCEFGND